MRSHICQRHVLIQRDDEAGHRGQEVEIEGILKAMNEG